jgi:hypothetical protein
MLEGQRRGDRSGVRGPTVPARVKTPGPKRDSGLPLRSSPRATVQPLPRRGGEWSVVPSINGATLQRLAASPAGFPATCPQTLFWISKREPPEPGSANLGSPRTCSGELTRPSCRACHHSIKVSILGLAVTKPSAIISATSRMARSSAPNAPWAVFPQNRRRGRPRRTGRLRSANASPAVVAAKRDQGRRVSIW